MAQAARKVMGPEEVPEEIVTTVAERMAAKTRVIDAGKEVDGHDTVVLSWLEKLYGAAKATARKIRSKEPVLSPSARVNMPDGKSYVLVTLVAPEDDLLVDDVVLRTELVRKYGSKLGNQYADRLYQTRTVQEFDQDQLAALVKDGTITKEILKASTSTKAKTHYPKYTVHPISSTNEGE